MEEIRKGIMRRRSGTATQYATRRPATESRGLKRVTSVGGRLGLPLGAKGRPAIPSASVAALGLAEQRGNMDKKKVMEMMLSNESVLMFLYESIFPSEKPKRGPTPSFRGLDIFPHAQATDRLAMTATSWKQHLL